MIYQTVKCTTCKKITRLINNPKGLINFGRCTLTSNCRGVLVQSIVPDITSDYNKNKPNWKQSKIIYNHTQTIVSNKWVIAHNLNNYPIANVFIDQNNRLVELRNGFTVEYNNINELSINFNNGYTGQVQCIARDSYEKQITSNINTTGISMVSYYSNVTLAIRKGYTFSINITNIYGKSTHINKLQNYLDPITILSPWYGYKQIQFNEQIYDLYEINLDSFIATNNITNQSYISIESIYKNNIIVNDTNDVALILLNKDGKPLLNSAVDFLKFNMNTNFIANKQLFVTPDIYRTILIS